MRTMMSHACANSASAGTSVSYFGLISCHIWLFYCNNPEAYYCNATFSKYMQCTEETHRPVSCETVSKWILKNSAESENVNWFVITHNFFVP